MALPRLGVKRPHVPDTIRTPKIAALDYRNSASSFTDLGVRALHAKYAMSIRGATRGRMSDGSAPGFFQSVLAANPACITAQYEAVQEIAPDPQTASDDWYPFWTDLNNGDGAGHDYWLRTAAGAKTQWTSSFNSWNINITNYVPARTSDGKRVPQIKAYWDYQLHLQYLVPYIKAVFCDNVWWMPRHNTASPGTVIGDVDRNGTDESASSVVDAGNAAWAAAWRQGYADYWTALRSYVSGLKIIGNTDISGGKSGVGGFSANAPSIAWPELTGKLEIAFLETMIGAATSNIESYGGIDQALYYYYLALSNIANPSTGYVLFNQYVNSSSGNLTSADWARSRYGLTMCMLGDGYHCLVDRTTTALGSGLNPWYIDEYDQPIGTPVESAPVRAGNIVYKRAYSNGIVVCNGTTSSQVVALPGTYRKFVGTQQPLINDGTTGLTSVTVPAKDGILLLK